MGRNIHMGFGEAVAGMHESLPSVPCGWIHVRLFRWGLGKSPAVEQFSGIVLRMGTPNKALETRFLLGLGSLK